MIESTGVPAKVLRQQKALVGIREEVAKRAGGSDPLSRVPSGGKVEGKRDQRK